jgi:hypothetical protein
MEPATRTSRKSQSKGKEARPKAKQSASGSTSLPVVQQVALVMKDHDTPLRAKEIQKKIYERYKRKVALKTLSARMDEKVKLGLMFSKPAPGTYALLP